MTRKLFLPLVLIILLAGCEQNKTSDKLDELGNELNDTLDETKKLLKEYTNIGKSKSKELETAAQGEVEKLFTFEYHVEVFPAETSAEEINERLSEIGKERWECFHGEVKSDGHHFYCKRRPKTYLRYLLRLL